MGVHTKDNFAIVSFKAIGMPRIAFEPNKSSAAKFLLQAAKTDGRKSADLNTRSYCSAYQELLFKSHR